MPCRTTAEGGFLLKMDILLAINKPLTFQWHNLTYLAPGLSNKQPPNLKQKQQYSLPQHISRSVSDNLQTITFSIYGMERTIVGIMTEVENYIYLYEYRGKQTGTEFFISFSKNSISYKLINVQNLNDN